MQINYVRCEGSPGLTGISKTSVNLLPQVQPTRQQRFVELVNAYRPALTLQFVQREGKEWSGDGREGKKFRQ